MLSVGDNFTVMKSIKLIQVAKFLNVSPAFLCEIRKGKKSFSKQKSKMISELTGISVERLLYTNGEGLYRELRSAYALAQEDGKQ